MTKPIITPETYEIGITYLLLGNLIASKIASAGRRTSLPKGYKIKDGKLVKIQTGSVSQKIRQRRSKKVRPVRRSA